MKRYFQINILVMALIVLSGCMELFGPSPEIQKKMKQNGITEKQICEEAGGRWRIDIYGYCSKTLLEEDYKKAMNSIIEREKEKKERERIKKRIKKIIHKIKQNGLSVHDVCEEAGFGYPCSLKLTEKDIERTLKQKKILQNAERQDISVRELCEKSGGEYKILSYKHCSSDLSENVLEHLIQEKLSQKKVLERAKHKGFSKKDLCEESGGYYSRSVCYVNIDGSDKKEERDYLNEKVLNMLIENVKKAKDKLKKLKISEKKLRKKLKEHYASIRDDRPLLNKDIDEYLKIRKKEKEAAEYERKAKIKKGKQYICSDGYDSWILKYNDNYITFGGVNFHFSLDNMFISSSKIVYERYENDPNPVYIDRLKGTIEFNGNKATCRPR